MSAKIILLCEGKVTRDFVRRFLRKRFNYHDIDPRPLPTRGSGEQWVREQFPRELQDIRRRRGAVLVVVTDEDTDATASRRANLDRQCIKDEIAPRKPDDPVMVAVPKRNIESWLWHLKNHERIDESTDYKRRLGGLGRSDLRDLAAELYRMCNREQRLLPTAPASLRAACREYPNLTRFLR